tara:strand:- start:1982 stop:2641 length:660 start_codon:yes stop_codon:yes gene_type:complete
MPDLKSKLIGPVKGVALDLFSDTGDLESYASTNLETVFSVILNEKDLKNMRERTPSRPVTNVSCFPLNTNHGLAYVRACLTSLEVCTLWIYMNRFQFNIVWFEKLMRTLYPLLQDDANVFLLCIDRGLALQYAKSHLLYIDRDQNILMHYHRQPLSNILEIDEIRQCCERNGYIHEATIRGDELLRMMKLNALPYDIWSSQIFFLLQFKVRPHFTKLVY